MKHNQSKFKNQVKSRKKYNKNRNYWRQQAHFVLSASSEGIYWCLSRKRGYYNHVLAAILKYVHQFPNSAFPSLETLQEEIDRIFGILIHTNSISRITRRMVEDGFLKKDGRLKDSNDFDSTMYLLADNFMWREYLEALVPLFPTTELINLIIQKYKPWTLALLFSINASVHRFKQTVKRKENKEYNLLVTYRKSMMHPETVHEALTGTRAPNFNAALDSGTPHQRTAGSIRYQEESGIFLNTFTTPRRSGARRGCSMCRALGESECMGESDLLSIKGKDEASSGIEQPRSGCENAARKYVEKESKGTAFCKGDTVRHVTHEEIITRLAQNGSVSSNRYHCPAHDDARPSLSVTLTDDDKTLFYCFSGCTFSEICAALDIEPRDCFPSEEPCYTKKRALYDYF